MSKVDLDYLVTFPIILNGKHLLVILRNERKLNSIHFLLLNPLLPVLFLLALLIDPLTLVVIMLHRSELAVIIDNIRHALPFLVDRFLDLLILLLDYFVDLLCGHELLAFFLVHAHGQFLGLVVLLVLG